MVMETVFTRTPTMKTTCTRYCAGCGHGLAHRLLAECIDELGIQDRTLGIAPVGCSVFAYEYLDVDMVEVAHGRAPAVATGMKRCRPDRIVFSYQGDGDLASIGAAEIMHATHRGENITVIFVNNAVYGMTGGQMAPTTMLGQVTETSPRGRTVENEGHPLRMAELLATLPGAVYVERRALSGPAEIRKAKQAIKHALTLQMNQKWGLGLVELLSPCPTYWRKSPLDAAQWIQEEMVKAFPLGKLKG